MADYFATMEKDEENTINKETEDRTVHRIFGAAEEGCVDISTTRTVSKARVTSIYTCIYILKHLFLHVFIYLYIYLYIYTYIFILFPI